MIRAALLLQEISQLFLIDLNEGDFNFTVLANLLTLRKLEENLVDNSLYDTFLLNFIHHVKGDLFHFILSLIIMPLPIEPKIYAFFCGWDRSLKLGPFLLRREIIILVDMLI